jgi:hypothetical protein
VQDTAEAEVVALKESMKQLMQDRDRAVREDNAESNPTSNVRSRARVLYADFILRIVVLFFVAFGVASLGWLWAVVL